MDEREIQLSADKKVGNLRVKNLDATFSEDNFVGEQNLMCVACVKF